jgi:transcriptional regulator with XRE-family HTH domain
MKKIDHTQFILGSVMAKKNISGAVLAELLGVTRQTVNNMVNGRRDVTVSRLHDIARALGVPVKELFK